MSTEELVRNRDRQRFELFRDDVRVAHVTYSMRGGVLILDHTMVYPEFEGQGLGSAVARAVLDHVGGSGRPYRVECSFLRGWVAKHPDYAPEG